MRVAHGSQDSEHLSPPACPASAVCASCVFICFPINCTFTVGMCNLRDGSVNTLRTGDADLRFYITTVQDG